MELRPKTLLGVVLAAATVLLLWSLWGLWYGIAILAVAAGIYLSSQGRGQR